MAECPYNIKIYLLLLKYPVVGSGVSVNPSKSPSVRLKFGLNRLHWHWNAINIRSRTQEGMTVLRTFVFRYSFLWSIKLIDFVGKKIIFDLVWLHIVWIKFYLRVLEFLNSPHTLRWYLRQFSQVNTTFGLQSSPVSSSIKMWREIWSIWVEKKDEPFPIVLYRTACVKN